MARTIGRKNRNLVKRLVIEELEKTRGKPWLPTPPRQTIEEIVIEKLPVELWDTWEGADSEIRRIIWDTVSEGHMGSAMKEVAGEADSKREILRRCLRRAGYGVHPDTGNGNPHQLEKAPLGWKKIIVVDGELLLTEKRAREVQREFEKQGYSTHLIREPQGYYEIWIKKGNSTKESGDVGTALSPMHSSAGGVSRAEREKLLKIIESISETLTDEVWGVLHDDYIRLSQVVSDLAFENKLGPRRREKITLALNRFANAYHGHYKAPYTPDKAEMTEALAVVKKQVQGLS